MDRHIDDEDVANPACGGKKRKVSEMDSHLPLQALKQRVWMRRKDLSAADGQAWRGAKLRRVGAKKWCTNVDAQLRLITPTEGLKCFEQNLGMDKWMDWRRWPPLSLTYQVSQRTAE